MNKCEMCGRETNQLQNRFYGYDNGENFMAPVCQSCADLHDSLLKVKK